MSPAPLPLPPPPRPAAAEALALGADDWLESDHATASLWWNPARVPPLADGRPGLVGHFWSDDPAGEAGVALLEEACERLARQDVQVAIGPMNGNTWRAHRLVIESDGRPPFAMEPRNPEVWVDCFRRAGFKMLAGYSSAVVDLTREAPDFAALERRLAGRGLRVRCLDPGDFEGELARIHELSLVAFSGNYLYTPLALDEFFAAYSLVRAAVVPELVLLAECEGRLQGFVFGLPDLEAGAAGREPALVVKTLAVRPEGGWRGLGSLLVHQVQQRARGIGFTEAIHALQHEANPSLRLGSRFDPRVFRRYALFSRHLA